MQFLSSDMCSSMLSLKNFVYSEQHSTYRTYSWQRDQSMLQVVAYERLKTIKNYKTVSPTSGSSRLQEVVVY